MAKFKIVLPKGMGAETLVELDGVDITKEVVSIYVGAAVNEPTTVWVQYLNGEAEIWGETDD
jgi:hypothetical protein